MSRFLREIHGEFGAFWQKSAQEELNKIKAEYDKGELYVDDNGVLRNVIHRVAVEEVCEKVAYLGIAYNHIATIEARDEENRKSIAEYREAMKNYEPSEEELYEMRAAFGAGETVVDIFTGKAICL